MSKVTCFLKGNRYTFLFNFVLGLAIFFHSQAYADDNFNVLWDDYDYYYYVEVPRGKILTFNGKTQTGVEKGTGYDVSYGNARDVGVYTATVRLRSGYVWTDGTFEDKYIRWEIVRAKVDTPKVEPLPYNGRTQTGVERSDKYDISGINSAVKLGSYSTILKLRDGYIWSDGTTEDKEVKWEIIRAYVIEIPEGKALEYNGRSQCLYDRGNYSLYMGDRCATNVGKYTAILELNDDGYGWFDGTTDRKTVTWNITIGNTPIEAVLGKDVVVPFTDIKRSGRKGYIIPVKNVLEVKSNYYTKLIYTKVGKVRKISGRDRKCNKKIRVNKGNEQIILKRKLQKGEYVLKVRVLAKRTVNTRQQFKDAEVTITVQ